MYTAVTVLRWKTISLATLPVLILLMMVLLIRPSAVYASLKDSIAVCACPSGLLIHKQVICDPFLKLGMMPSGRNLGRSLGYLSKSVLHLESVGQWVPIKFYCTMNGRPTRHSLLSHTLATSAGVSLLEWWRTWFHRKSNSTRSVLKNYTSLTPPLTVGGLPKKVP